MRQQRIFRKLQSKRLPPYLWIRDLVVVVDILPGRNDWLEFGDWWTNHLEVIEGSDGNTKSGQNNDNEEVVAVEIVDKDTRIVSLNHLEQTLLTDHEVDQINGKHDAADRDEVESGLQE